MNLYFEHFRVLQLLFFPFVFNLSIKIGRSRPIFQKILQPCSHILFPWRAKSGYLSKIQPSFSSFLRAVTLKTSSRRSSRVKIKSCLLKNCHYNFIKKFSYHLLFQKRRKKMCAPFALSISSKNSAATFYFKKGVNNFVPFCTYNFLKKLLNRTALLVLFIIKIIFKYIPLFVPPFIKENFVPMV